MELEAVSGAAVIAVTSTIVYLIVAKTWNTASRAVSSTPNFSDRIMPEAAQRFRDELERLTSSQSMYLSGAMVFTMLFSAAMFLNAEELFAGYPSWQLYLQLSVLVLAGVGALFRIGRTVLARHRVKFVRDANIAVGHQLQQLATGFGRVFHDVPTSNGVIDHVLVGQSGVYAVNVVAQRSAKRAHARLQENALQFSNGKPERSIVDIAAATKRLQKELRGLTGLQLRVRSVIAVPGWDIGDQTSDDHLLVNERTIAMLSGWKDNSDYLMNEDVDALYSDLTKRCVSS